MGTANFGIAGLDWQQRVNWDRLKKYRTERATNSSVPIMASISSIAAISTPWVWK